MQGGGGSRSRGGLRVSTYPFSKFHFQFYFFAENVKICVCIISTDTNASLDYTYCISSDSFPRCEYPVLNTEKHSLEQDTLSQNLTSESLENQGPQEPEIEIGANHRTLAFEQINTCTWKLTDGRGSLAWSGDRSGGYRTSRAIAWLLGVGGGRWVVRYKKRASKPLKLPKAKAYAMEMVKGVRPGKLVEDTIGRLLRLHLDALEPMPSLAQVWAIETANYPSLTRFLPTEDCRVNATPALHFPPEDCKLDPDGYPMLPECLRRISRVIG